MDKKIDKSQVKKVAKLARLDLSEAEIEEFAGQLNAIIDYVERMNTAEHRRHRAVGALPAG